MNTKHLLLVCLLLAAVPVYGASFYTACPDDPVGQELLVFDFDVPAGRLRETLFPIDRSC